MSSQDIKSYVINCLRGGFDREAIEKAVSKSGWPEDEIEKVFNDQEVRAVFNEFEALRRSVPKEISAEIVHEEEEEAVLKQKTRPSSEDTSYLRGQVSSEAEVKLDEGNPEADPQLKEYIMQNLDKGFDPSLMKDTVVNAGWPEGEVEKVFRNKDVKKLIATLNGEADALSGDVGGEVDSGDGRKDTGFVKNPKSFVVPFVHRSNSELKNYVINEIKKGGSKLSVKAAAVDAGWPEGEVDKVFEDEDIKNEIPSSKKDLQLSSKKSDPKKKVPQEENFLDEFINPAGYKSQKPLARSDIPNHKESSVNPLFSIFDDKSKSLAEEEEAEEREMPSDEGPQEEEEEEEALPVVQEETSVEKVVRDPYLELRTYIMNELKRGVSRLAIKTAAVDAGWPGGEIDKIFNEKELKDLSSSRLK